jgi:hypothetical protein
MLYKNRRMPNKRHFLCLGATGNLESQQRAAEKNDLVL